jgi:hypothetical protein
MSHVLAAEAVLMKAALQQAAMKAQAVAMKTPVAAMKALLRS